ncbi:MAG: MBL fold metallo-hydrolase [Clostridia bacterium]|nr:MBL fold metallo-hydrolase [Clostridia bacterium]
MGYRAKKEKVENKKKIFKRVLLGILLLCIIGLAIFSVFVPPNTWKYYVKLPKVGTRGDGELRVHFIDVGQGDSAVIELPDGKIVMIDGGDSAEATEKTVLRYLNALKIKTIDYLVVTHADEDHCGSLKAVIENKNVLNAYIPPSKPADDEEYEQVYEALLREDCAIRYASGGVKNLGISTEEYEYNLSFIYPFLSEVNDLLETEQELDEEGKNYFSSVLYLEYVGFKSLFMADVPEEIERRIVDSDKVGAFENRGFDLREIDLLKVSHHGSKTATCEEFLAHTTPKTAVISCGANNAYGHPASSVTGRLTAAEADIYRTDIKGHIIVTVEEGGEYWIKTV